MLCTSCSPAPVRGRHRTTPVVVTMGAIGPVLAALLAGCPPRDEPPAVTRGRQAYMGTCIACHNMDPALDGAVGPAVRGASKELLTAKVLRGEYPAGHKPKRDTRVMPAQPNMAGSIDDLVAFLNAP